MAHVERAVLGLHHGPERYHLDDILLALAFDVAQEAVQVAADVGPAARSLEFVPKLRDEVSEVQKLFRVGILMDAIGQNLGLLVLGNLADAFGHRSVCQQHELLDELGGVRRHLEIDAGRVSVVVDIEAHLASVEIDSSRSKTPLTQLLGHAVQDNQRVFHFRGKGQGAGGRRIVGVGGALLPLAPCSLLLIIFRTCLAALLENLLHLFV